VSIADLLPASAPHAPSAPSAPSARKAPSWRPHPRAAGVLGALRVLGLAWPLLLAACGATHERGYYAPAGADFGDALATQQQAGPDIILDLACQGAFVNRASGQQVSSVYVQLDLTRPRSGELRLSRDALVVDVQLADGGPRLSLKLSEAWSRRERVTGDLVVPAWALRPFDLFFDSSLLVGEPPPASVLLRWEGAAAAEPIEGQCLFVRILAGDPRLPNAMPMKDMSFGMRNGYYLPGWEQLGSRWLRPSTEERLHYTFHDPDSFQW